MSIAPLCALVTSFGAIESSLIIFYSHYKYV
jgi:hypothetical protein